MGGLQGAQHSLVIELIRTNPDREAQWVGCPKEWYVQSAVRQSKEWIDPGVESPEDLSLSKSNRDRIHDLRSEDSVLLGQLDPERPIRWNAEPLFGHNPN